MIGTYAAALAVCASSLAIGQAALGLCGRRRWSWLAPAAEPEAAAAPEPEAEPDGEAEAGEETA